MKTIYAEQPYRIGIREIPRPQPKDSEILLHVAYAGVCGSDLHAYRGQHAFRKPPVMLGHEVSGIVEQVGPGVRTISPGDKVSIMPQVGCGACEHCASGRINLCASKILPGTANWMGAFGEYFTAPESAVCQLGEVSLKLGAVVEPLAVACHVMDRFPRKHGKDLVILGAGAIGLMLLIIAPHYGFENIMMTDILDYNLILAKELGAKEVVNVTLESAADWVHALFGPTGVENAIIAAGGPDILAQAIDVADLGGTLLYFAMITKEMTLNTYPIVFKELNVMGSLNYTMRDFETAVQFLGGEGERIERLITHVLPLEEAHKAFEILDQKTENSVKVLLKNG